MPKWAISTLVLAVAAGCGHPASTQSPKIDLEITSNPTVIERADIPTTTFSYHGLHLGDPESSIPSQLIVTPKDQHGNIAISNDGDDIEVANGKIVSIRIADPKVLIALRIESRNDVQMRFGKADTVEPTQIGPGTTYNYFSRHLRYMYFEPNSNGQISSIMIEN